MLTARACGWELPGRATHPAAGRVPLTGARLRKRAEARLVGRSVQAGVLL